MQVSDQKIQVEQLYQERTGQLCICILVEVAVDPVYFITLHYNKTSTLHYITLLMEERCETLWPPLHSPPSVCHWPTIRSDQPKAFSDATSDDRDDDDGYDTDDRVGDDGDTDDGDDAAHQQSNPIQKFLRLGGGRKEIWALDCVFLEKKQFHFQRDVSYNWRELFGVLPRASLLDGSKQSPIDGSRPSLPKRQEAALISTQRVDFEYLPNHWTSTWPTRPIRLVTHKSITSDRANPWYVGRTNPEYTTRGKLLLYIGMVTRKVRWK